MNADNIQTFWVHNMHLGFGTKGKSKSCYVFSAEFEAFTKSDRFLS